MSLNLEPPPPPPPTSDALEVFSSSLDVTNMELSTGANGNKCLLPLIESSGALSKSGAKPITNDFLPSDLLLALKRQDTTGGGQLYTPRKGTKLSLSPKEETQLSARLKGVKAPPKLWGYTSRRARLKHLTNAPPCICGAGKDISFLYDSPREQRENVKKVTRVRDRVRPQYLAWTMYGQALPHIFG